MDEPKLTLIRGEFAPVIPAWRRVVDRLWWVPLLPILVLIGMEFGGYVLLAAPVVWGVVRLYELIFPKRLPVPAPPPDLRVVADESSRSRSS